MMTMRPRNLSVATIEPDRYDGVVETFDEMYAWDFDTFWRWKLNTESRGGSILDRVNAGETYERLCDILASWQAYRPLSRREWQRPLKESLGTIQCAYEEIRRYTLLQFGDIPTVPLNVIWHELGGVKSEGNCRNPDESYLIIAVCKPLMLMWGQSLAFDTNVRGSLPKSCGTSAQHRSWGFVHWTRTMGLLQRQLSRNTPLLEHFRQLSADRYGSDTTVPYGRFLDMYYWSLA